MSSPFEKPMTLQEYEREVAASRDARMRWWVEARFGMFVHYSPFALCNRNEWVMALEGYSPEEYEREVTVNFHPRKGCAYEWAKLAAEAGCKYMVLTTRHHEGYSLWDSQTNPYNVVQFGGDHDVVAEYVDACRQYGLKVGLYHSVMDWHNPDGSAAAWDMAARARFAEFHRGMLRELMTNYGKIDILWYDCCLPCGGEELDFVNINRMVRTLQPEIIINPRCGLPEDIDTPEDRITASAERYWEACMTFNGLSWSNLEAAQAEPYTYNAQRIIKMLNTVTEGRGNLLLNIGPAPDGSVPTEAVEPLRQVGAWLRVNGDAVYGDVKPSYTENLGDRHMFWTSCGHVSRKDNRVFSWNFIWPRNGEFRLAGIMTKVIKVRCLADGREYPFTQEGALLKITGLPYEIPDKAAGVTVLEITCTKLPKLMAVPFTYPMTRLSSVPPIEE